MLNFIGCQEIKGQERNIDSTDLSRDGIELDPFSAPLAVEITAEVVSRSLTLNMVQEFGAGHAGQIGVLPARFPYLSIVTLTKKSRDVP